MSFSAKNLIFIVEIIEISISDTSKTAYLIKYSFINLFGITVLSLIFLFMSLHISMLSWHAASIIDEDSTNGINITMP